MPIEIEKKFLVDQQKLDLPASGTRIVQGYLPMSDETLTVVRVRIKGDKGFLTLKGANVGATRAEYEYEVPMTDAEEMLAAFCTKSLDKVRYEIPLGGHTWEIDVFSGGNAGLVVAEIELSDEDEAFERPGWLGEEVTSDPRYYNSSLVVHPYRDW